MSDARRGLRVPWGLVGMVVLVAAAEGAVARRGMDFLDPDDWAYRRCRQAASREATRAGVLCFGDSLVKFGVAPGAVRDRSGRTAYNLAIPGAQAPASDVLLRRALRSGARPSAVVVDFMPPLLAAPPRHNLTRWPYLLDLPEAASVARAARDPDLFGLVAVGRVLPSARARAAVRANVMAALDGRPGPWRWANVLAFRNWNRNGNAQMMPASGSVASLTAAEVEDWRQRYYSRMTCHPANAEAVGRFLAAAAAHDVPVYWVLTPLWPALHASLARSGFDAEHEAFVRSWQARFPNLTVVDGRGAVADPGGFYDPNHLSAAGAYAFSRALGDVLREPPPGPNAGRWVKVPACPTGPAPDGAEDLDQSRLALEAMGRARR